MDQTPKPDYETLSLFVVLGILTLIFVLGIRWVLFVPQPLAPRPMTEIEAQKN